MRVATFYDLPGIPPEGATAVMVYGVASETKSVRTDRITWTYAPTDSACIGSYTISTTTGTTTTTYPSASASNSASYRVDLVGPVIRNFVGGTDVQQGEGLVFNLDINEGSAGAAYTATLNATGPASLGPFTVSGNFSSNPQETASGIAGPQHVGPLSLSTSCSTPVGYYTLGAKVDSDDLAGNHAYSVNASRSFTVSPALMTLQSRTVVVSDFGASYGFDQCFTSTQSNKQINNNPGSVHIAEVVTSAGTCLGTSNLSGVKLTLQLPVDFSFTAPGKSPPAHIFVFNASGTGFDFHNPPNEVTAMVTQTSCGTGCALLDLSNVVVNGGAPGVIPATWTIYARAKAGYSGSSAAAADRLFVFNSSATEAGSGLTAGPTSSTVVSNPSTQACVNGILQ